MRCLGVLLLGCGRIAFDETQTPTTSLPEDCSPLPPPRGRLVEVEAVDAARLGTLVAAAEPGTTFVLGDGTFAIDEIIVVSAANVTIRSRSGDPQRTVLDGMFATTTLLGTVAANTTFAELGVRHALSDAIQIGTPAQPAPGAVVYGMRIAEAGAAMVRVRPGSDDGTLMCSRLDQTDIGRARTTIDPNGNCSSGGVVATDVAGWTVTTNQLSGLRCENGLALPGVGFLQGSSATRVARNFIFDGARAIAFGNGNAPGNGHVGGEIVNNVIWSENDLETGISLEQAAGTRVYHNTVLNPPGPTFFSSIDVRFPQTTADVRNNLTIRISERDGSAATLATNLTDTPLDRVIDAPGLDFHLSPTAIDAIDRGSVVPDAGPDLDGERRVDGAPDLGADER